MVIEILFVIALYYFIRTAIIKYHKLGGWKQEKSILSQFWRLEVHNQGVSRAMLTLRPWAETFLASS